MPDFSMQRYYTQYIEACTALTRAQQKLENITGSADYYSDIDAFQATLAAAEKEYQAAKDKADELWYLANTGKHKKDFPPPGSPAGFNAFLTTGGLQPFTRFPEPPPPRRLP